MGTNVVGGAPDNAAERATARHARLRHVWVRAAAAGVAVGVAAAVVRAQPAPGEGGGRPRGLFDDEPEQKSPPGQKPTKPAPSSQPTPSPTPPPRPETKLPEPKPATPPVVPPAREPIPSAARQAAAERLVKDVFKSDYVKRDRRPLMGKLLSQAASPTEPPDVRYVLLREARDVATAAGDYATARRAIEAMAATWAVDARAARQEVMAVVVTAVSPADAPVLAADASAAADDALDRGDVELARRFATVAESAAARGTDRAPLAQPRDGGQEIRGELDESLRAQQALAALAGGPDDPAANLTVGKFLCLVKGDWARGLPLLATGGSDPAAALASRDLAGAATADAKLATGDAWRAYAQTQAATPTAGRRAAGRAEHWYLAALPGAQGLERAAVIKRLADLSFGVSFPKLAARWDGRRARTNLSSMTRPGGQVDASPSPGLLVGFEVKPSSWRGRPMIKILRPVYLTDQGRVTGRQFGQVQKGTQGPAVLTPIEAKPGYAVGGIRAHKDERLRGFQIVFMRVHGAVLNPVDRYESEWVGRSRPKNCRCWAGTGGRSSAFRPCRGRRGRAPGWSCWSDASRGRRGRLTRSGNEDSAGRVDPSPAGRVHDSIACSLLVLDPLSARCPLVPALDWVVRPDGTG